MYMVNFFEFQFHFLFKANFRKHKVAKGETINQISKKIYVTPLEFTK